MDWEKNYLDKDGPVPTDLVWDNIEAELNKRRKNNVLFIVLFGMFMLLVGIIFGWLINKNSNQESKIRELEYALEFAQTENNLKDKSILKNQTQSNTLVKIKERAAASLKKVVSHRQDKQRMNDDGTYNEIIKTSSSIENQKDFRNSVVLIDKGEINFEERVLFTTMNIPKIHAPLKINERIVDLALPIILVSKDVPKKWKINLEAGPNKVKHRLTPKNQQGEFAKLLMDREGKEVLTTKVMATLDYSLSDRLFVRSSLGFLRANNEIELNRTIRLGANPLIDLNGNNAFVQSYPLSTSLGVIDDEVSAFVDSDFELEEGEVINFQKQISQKTQSLLIPLSIGYEHKIGSKISMNAYCGTQVQFIIDSKTSISPTSFDSNIPNQTFTNILPLSNRVTKNENLNKIMFSTFLGAGLSYNIFKQLDINLGGLYSFGITPIYEDERIRTNLDYASVTAGISYRL